MQFPLNKPMVLSTAGIAVRTVTVTVVPTGPGYVLANPAAVLSLNDASTIAGATIGNQLWSATLSALAALVGATIPLPTTTSNGLVVSAVPPGVGVIVDYG
jgi:hypothetical protein